MTSNTIIHGDCRDLASSIDRPINCIITDPPYGLDYESNQAQSPEAKLFARKLEGDMTLEEALELFQQVMSTLIPKLADEADIYIFTGWGVLPEWRPAVERLTEYSDVPITLKQTLVWAKGWPGQGDLKTNWGCGHEFILYLKKGKRPIGAYRRQAVLHFESPIEAEIAATEHRLEVLKGIRDTGKVDFAASGVIDIDKPATKQHVHPTEKPVALIEQLVRMSTDPGELIVDPFSGSGSTSVAARNLGRDSIAYEVDENYARAGKARLAQMGLF